MKMTPRSARRNGLTLVEIMAALTALTMVLGIAAALISLLFKLSDSGQKHSADEMAMARLARIFRQDARSADFLETRPSGQPSPSITFYEIDGSTIEYLGERDGILRVVSLGGTMVEQERLALPDAAVPRFERRDDDGRTLVILAFHRGTSKTNSKLANKAFRIEAMLGANTRFDPAGGGKP